MKNDKGSMKPVAWLWLVVATMLAMGAFCPPQALAQVPARFYWKTLSDANAVPLIFQSVSGNTNPLEYVEARPSAGWLSGSHSQLSRPRRAAMKSV